MRWIREHAESLGIAPNEIVLMGGSAGGHLARSTALFESIDDKRDNLNLSTEPNAFILMYPVIDASKKGYGQTKIGPRGRGLSPVHNVRRGLPPILMFHRTADAVTPYPGAERFHELAMAAKNLCRLVTHPGGRHGSIIFDPKMFDGALEQMQTFLREQDLLFDAAEDVPATKSEE